MSARVTYTSLAEADLAALWDYIAPEDPAAAERVIDELRALAERLAAMPGMGRQRPELHPECRSFPSGTFVVFSRTIQDGMEVLRVARGARDAERLF